MNDPIRARLDLEPYNGRSSGAAEARVLASALKTVLYLCSDGLAYENPRTLKWYIKCGIAEELGLDRDEVEF